MAIAKVDIFNLALIGIGAQTVASPTENTKNAKACLQVYDMLRLAELRKKPAWNFAIKMAELPASATTPLFDRAYSYPLPSDFLALASSFPENNTTDKDWIIQNGQIYTNWGAPLQIRYVADIVDPNEMDHLFRISLACKIREVISESLVQSNTKKETAKDDYKEAIAEAKKANAFDQLSAEFPTDVYLSVRD